MVSPARYFAATLLGGRLHVLAEGRPWDPTRLDWWREDELDLILAGGTYGVKVRTVEETPVLAAVAATSQCATIF